MNNVRTAYLKKLPYVLLAALLVTALNVYKDLFHKDYDYPGEISLLSLAIYFGTYSLVYVFMGWALQKMKAAAWAVVTLALVYVINYVLYNKFEQLQEAGVISVMMRLLFNIVTLPALVFGMAAFGRRALRYFWPAVVVIFGLMLLRLGSAYVEQSPYTVWYRILRLHQVFIIKTAPHTEVRFEPLRYAYFLSLISILYIIIGELCVATVQDKSFKKLLHIDFDTRYSKATALTLFYISRLTILLLGVALYNYPLSSFRESGPLYFRGQSAFDIVSTIIISIAVLAFVVLYYRKFLVEYFISIRKKLSWLFWVVNIPVIGWLVFPFVVTAAEAEESTEARTQFFYNESWHGSPYGILITMLLVSMLGIIGPRSDMASSSYWLLWLVELGLLTWYVAHISGYYALLGIGVASFLIFIRITHVTVSNHPPEITVWGSNSADFRYSFALSLWLIAAFNVIQYVIWIPIFHLNTSRTVQQPEVLIAHDDAVLPEAGL